MPMMRMGMRMAMNEVEGAELGRPHGPASYRVAPTGCHGGARRVVKLDA